MQVLPTLKRALGVVTVTELNNEIYVSGVDSGKIILNINSLWDTSTITKHMLKSVGYSSFSFSSFFAPEMLYIMENLKKKRSLSINVKAISKIVQQLKTNTWLKNVFDEKTPGRLDYKKLKEMKYLPLEHQKPWFEYYDKIPQKYGLNGALMNVAAGGGKTLMSLMTLQMVGVDYVIVVSPKNAVLRVWRDTVLDAFVNTPSCYTSLDAKSYNREKFAIFHYEALDKALAACSLMNGHIGIVLDESHNLTDINSLRTDLFLKLCSVSKSKNIIFASGTPIG